MYLASNANLTMYGAGWRMWTLALVGKMLGIQFKVCGIPFGAPYDRARDEAFFGPRADEGVQSAGRIGPTASGPDHRGSGALGGVP